MKTSFYSQLKALLAVLPAGLLAACETVVDLPEPPHTPRIALQYTLSNTPPAAGTNPDPNAPYSYDMLLSRTLFVSHSQRIFNTRQLEGRDDATVEIRDEQGTVVEKFVPSSAGGRFYGPGYYQPTMKLLGQPGRTYTLRAALPGFETVESTLTLPQQPAIAAATFTARPRDPNGQPNLTRGLLTITVVDDPNTADYYLAFARVLDKNGTPGIWSPVYAERDDQQEDFGVGRFELSDLNSSYSTYPYADTDVNGQRFVLNSDVAFYQQTYCPNQTNCPELGYLEVFVSKITPDTYRFYQSQRRYADSEGNLFAEPAPLASNIRTGYGLFGGAMDASYRIKLF